MTAADRSGRGLALPRGTPLPRSVAWATRPCGWPATRSTPAWGSGSWPSRRSRSGGASSRRPCKPQVEAVQRQLRLGHRSRLSGAPAPSGPRPGRRRPPDAPRVRCHLPDRRAHRGGRVRRPRCSTGWPGRPDLDVVAFGVTWRGRDALAASVPAGVAIVSRPMAARPLRQAWRRVGPPRHRAVDRGRSTSSTGPTSWCRPTRHAAEVVTVHDLTCVRFPELCTRRHARVPGPHPPGRAPRGRRSTPCRRFVADEVREASASRATGSSSSPTGSGAARRRARHRCRRRAAPRRRRPLRAGGRHRRTPQGPAAAGARPSTGWPTRGSATCAW